jgi:hypothetical protein
MKKLEEKDNDSIELIDELRDRGFLIGKKHMAQVDDWKHTLGD